MTVNHIILNGSLVVLTDGRVLDVPAKDARVTNVWSLSTRLEIWRDDPASPFQFADWIDTYPTPELSQAQPTKPELLNEGGRGSV